MKNLGEEEYFKGSQIKGSQIKQADVSFLLQSFRVIPTVLYACSDYCEVTGFLLMKMLNAHNEVSKVSKHPAKAVSHPIMVVDVVVDCLWW